MSHENPPALEVMALSYHYGQKQALSDVSFSVAAGGCTILLGPNGAGKSTLFSLITHLYDSPEGEIRIAGHDIRREPERALARLGVVFQQPTLDLDLSVAQNLRYHASLHGLAGKKANERIEEELERQGIYQRAGEKVRVLNGGHRRRVEIARALLHRPDLLLLDEPTVGLDVPSRKSIVNHVHQLAQTGNMAVLWASHLIDEIHDSDDLIILHQGKVRAHGRVGQVLEAHHSANIGEAFDRLTGRGETSA